MNLELNMNIQTAYRILGNRGRGGGRNRWGCVTGHSMKEERV